MLSFVVSRGFLLQRHTESWCWGFPALHWCSNSRMQRSRELEQFRTSLPSCAANGTTSFHFLFWVRISTAHAQGQVIRRGPRILSVFQMVSRPVRPVLSSPWRHSAQWAHSIDANFILWVNFIGWNIYLANCTLAEQWQPSGAHATTPKPTSKRTCDHICFETSCFPTNYSLHNSETVLNSVKHPKIRNSDQVRS